MSDTKLRVTLLQQPMVWHEPATNRQHFESLLKPLTGQTDLVLLPETFTTGFSMKASSLAERPEGPTAEWLQRMARELNAVVTGSVLIEDSGTCRNRLLWASPVGIQHYDKRHLFRMAREHEHFAAGKNALFVEWRGFRIVPLVCYDLRFPVFSRRRPELDYDLLVYVANWPSPRRNAWRQLLRARAIENIAFVAGVNRIGVDGAGNEYSGDSVAVDFMGEPLVDLGNAAAAATVTFDLAALKAFRERFPAHLDADRFTLAE